MRDYGFILADDLILWSNSCRISIWIQTLKIIQYKVRIAVKNRLCVFSGGWYKVAVGGKQ